jgi:hypothetical protein
MPLFGTIATRNMGQAVLAGTISTIVDISSTARPRFSWHREGRREPLPPSIREPRLEI